MQFLKINSRIITILGIICSILGLAIMADWQSILYDPCTEYSLYHHPELARNYSISSLSVITTNQQDFEELHTQITDSVYGMAMNKCESFLNSAKYHCHWIPNSEITNSHCGACPPICRNEKQTLNFVQFCIGAFEFILTIHISRLGSMIVMSDIMAKEYQVGHSIADLKLIVKHYICTF